MSSIEPVEGREVATAQALEQGPAPVPVHCRNCGALLAGRYCADCSQAANVHVPTTRELLHEFMEGLTHSDSRLWRTLVCLWFKPGNLTEEFIAGRRVAYLPPFRLYLILSVIFFLIASFSHTRTEFIKFDNATSHHEASRASSCEDISGDWLAKHPGLNQRIKHACTEVVRDNGNNMMHITVATMPKAMFIFLPLVAFLHMLMYWWPRHRYAEHLLFFVHLHAFFFSVSIILILSIDAAEYWPSLERASGILQTLLGWSLPIYTVVAMRRVFNRSWVGTAFKALALYVVYMAVLGITVAGVFVYALLQL
jgi:hypothetical protein